MNKLQQLLKNRIVILDGATGANLFAKGLAPGESPSVLNVRDEEIIYALQKAYVDAGSDIILTNTFSANPQNFSSAMLGKVIRSGVTLAKRAAGKKILLGDVGPLGDLIKPYGVKDFEAAVNDYKAIFRMLSSTGLRNFFLETFTSILDAKAAFLAAKEYATEIYVCFSFGDNGRTIMGDTPESIAVTFEALGARGVGANCSSPDMVVEALQRMASVVQIPLIAKPNAGHVTIKEGVVHNTMAEAELARYFTKFVRAGANMVGGCCGTTPEYIRAIAKKRLKPVMRQAKREFYLTSPNRVISVDVQKTLVVGECLNPSGRKKLRESLKQKNYRVYGADAMAQEKAGADALDVNAFVDILDERDTMLNAVGEVIKNTSVPLFIDTQDFKTAEAVLRFYPGVGVYNSIPARRDALLKWLPMVRRYGFKAVVSLIGKTIPKDKRERMKNARFVLSVAKRIRFPIEDLIFDPLVFPVATEQTQIDSTLETLSELRRMGLKTILGISNVSYGLPDRSVLNAALTTAALKKHATFLILNPLDEDVMGAINASKVLFQNEGLTKFIERYRTTKRLPVAANDIVSAIVHGNVEAGVTCAKESLDAGVSVKELTEKYLTKALETVGSYYEKGEFFIPDLLKAAEVAQSILGLIKRYMPTGAKRGKIIVATVKGDIHDIGKNLAAMIFESAGYEVIDLGKDVDTAAIVGAVRKHRPAFVGLSALLTTTMPEMENVIKALKHGKLNVSVIIGGPNVSSSYAQKIGALGAARNAFEGLRLVKNKNRATR
ncbi:MAG: homocysteine S-methyltransferase family protein [bacterium]